MTAFWPSEHICGPPEERTRLGSMHKPYTLPPTVKSDTGKRSTSSIPALLKPVLQHPKRRRPLQPHAPLLGRPQQRVRPLHVRFGRERGEVRRPKAVRARSLAQQVRGEGLPGGKAVGENEGAEKRAACGGLQEAGAVSERYLVSTEFDEQMSGR